MPNYRSLMLVAILGALSAQPALAALGPIKQLDPEQIRGEDACAVLAAYATAPKSPSDMPDKAAACSRADKDTCSDTLEFLRSREKEDVNFQKAMRTIRCRR